MVTWTVEWNVLITAVAVVGTNEVIVYRVMMYANPLLIV